MRRNEVIDVLRRQEPEARALGVSALYLFGSAARDEARPDSDVDVFVDYDLDRFGLIELARLQRQRPRGRRNTWGRHSHQVREKYRRRLPVQQECPHPKLLHS